MEEQLKRDLNERAIKLQEAIKLADRLEQETEYALYKLNDTRKAFVSIKEHLDAIDNLVNEKA